MCILRLGPLSEVLRLERKGGYRKGWVCRAASISGCHLCPIAQALLGCILMLAFSVLVVSGCLWCSRSLGNVPKMDVS